MTIEEIKERRAEITQGKWNCLGETLNAGQRRLITGKDKSIPVWFKRWADAIFCASAPADIDWLIDKLESVQSQPKKERPMSIKDRMEKDQTWQSVDRIGIKITGPGAESFFFKVEGYSESFISYAAAELQGWKMTHEANGVAVCEFCRRGDQPCCKVNDAGWCCTRIECHQGDHVACSKGDNNHGIHRWSQEADCNYCGYYNQPICEAEGICSAGFNHKCTITRGHDGDHVSCHDLAMGGINHERHRWPQEQVKPPEFRKVDIWHFGVLTQHQQGITLADAMSRGDYIGWLDDRGNLRGVFRRKDGSPAVSLCLTVEQWESDEWEVVKPKKVLFEGGWR